MQKIYQLSCTKGTQLGNGLVMLQQGKYIICQCFWIRITPASEKEVELRNCNLLIDLIH